MVSFIMGISWIDKRQLINFVFLGQFFFWGCSSVKVPVYSEPILLDQNPVVFVRYAYNEVQLNVSAKVVDGNPTAYELGIYKVHDMDSPLLSRIFFPGETMSVILPSKSVCVEDSGNVVIVVPQGDDFEIVKHFFKIDGHLTKFGHKVIAEKLSEILIQFICYYCFVCLF